MPTWTLPMPPSGANHATQAGRGRIYRTAESLAWERGVRLLVGGWTPPPRTPLVADVRLYFPRSALWRRAADKWAAVCLDAILGVRGDEWVQAEAISKIPSDNPRVEVTVEAAVGQEGQG